MSQASSTLTDRELQDILPDWHIHDTERLENKVRGYASKGEHTFAFIVDVKVKADALANFRREMLKAYGLAKNS